MGTVPPWPCNGRLVPSHVVWPDRDTQINSLPVSARDAASRRASAHFGWSRFRLQPFRKRRMTRAGSAFSAHSPAPSSPQLSGVAQRLERLVRDQEVGGSNPLAPNNLYYWPVALVNPMNTEPRIDFVAIFLRGREPGDPGR